MATRPTKVPLWNTGTTNQLEPLAGEKVTGWTPGAAPPAEYMNWLQYFTGQWAQYLSDGVVVGSGSGVAGWTSTGGGGNSDGVVGIGTGTFSGVVGYGGTATGRGGYFRGGDIGGAGLDVAAVAGDSNGATIVGHGAGYGLDLSSGATAPAVLNVTSIGSGSIGIKVVATVGNADGIQATGHGTFNGVIGTGGATAGTGVSGQGGAGGGIGVVGNGGSVSGVGVFGQGVGTGVGGWFAAAGTTAPAAKVDGSIDFTGATDPASTADVGHQLVKQAFSKAQGYVEGLTVRQAFGVASLAYGTGGDNKTLEVNFSHAFADAFYIADITIFATGTPYAARPQARPFNVSTTKMRIAAFDFNGVTAVDLSAGLHTVIFTVRGKQ